MCSGYRIESDLIGEVKILNSAYYGIHTLRSLENFPVSGRKVNANLINAFLLVKKAAAMAHARLGMIEPDIANAIIGACDDILTNDYTGQFPVDALQGGAGTSTNMNVNEVVANRAIEILGGPKGSYGLVHPLHHVNKSQSTNDIYPTSLRIASINLLRILSESFASLQEELQKKENEFADILKLGRTQLMDALPMMAGQGFGSYARAVSRDRWRLYKVEERLRQINIGGTAIGTGMNAPLKYTFLVTDILQDISGLGLARSEFPMDTTQNMDVFAEVSGLLKASSVNLSKIAGDLRLLSSGPFGGIGEYKLPPVQAGSSIMPGKVNPVIPEMVIQVAMKVSSNDLCITSAAMNGQLELNQFMPLIAESLLESMELINNAVLIFKDKCIKGLAVNKDICKKHVLKSRCLATALVHHIGYDRASSIVKKSLEQQKTIKQVVIEEKILSKKQIDKILDPYQVTKPGIPGI